MGHPGKDGPHERNETVELARVIPFWPVLGLRFSGADRQLTTGRFAQCPWHGMASVLNRQANSDAACQSPLPKINATKSIGIVILGKPRNLCPTRSARGGRLHAVRSQGGWMNKRPGKEFLSGSGTDQRTPPDVFLAEFSLHPAPISVMPYDWESPEITYQTLVIPDPD